MATVLGMKNKTMQSDYRIDTKFRDAVKKTWSVVYYVLGDTDEREDDIVDAPGLPILYEVYYNGWATGKSVQEVTAVQGGYLWEVLCNFNSEIEGDIPVVDIQWDIEEKDEVIKYDAITGIPILNSAKEPITTTAPLSIPVLSMTRIEATFTATRILLYNNHINQYTFMGAPSYCALMSGPTARKKVVQGQRKWEVTYRIKFNMKINPQTLQPSGWRLFLLDHGTRFISDTDDDGNPIYEKFKTDEEKDDDTGNLDGFGYPLPDGDPEIYLGYNRYPLVNFNNLGLET